MAFTTNAPIFPQSLDRIDYKFIQGGTGTLSPQAIYTFGTNAPNGGTVQGLTCVNTDTISHLLQFLIVNSNGTILLNTASLTASSGNNGTTLPIAPMSSVNWGGLVIDGNGNPGKYFANGDTLMAQYQQGFTVSASSIGIGGDVQIW